jgi:hypothetical protein
MMNVLLLVFEQCLSPEMRWLVSAETLRDRKRLPDAPLEPVSNALFLQPLRLASDAMPAILCCLDLASR